jgi:RNA polymerase sigma-70 factor (ECF subfamily)
MAGRAGTDEDLVRRAQRGDRAAFDELVVRHRDRVYAVALRLTRNPADAEDALQDTFLNAYRGLARFGGRARVSTWLYRIAANASFDVIARRRGRDQPLDEGAHEPAATGDPFAQSAERRALERALAALPDEFREAVVLCDIAGLGAGEAAELIGVPAGTVKSRVFRARALLAAALREPDAHDPVETSG